jgi:hypothetical protein
MRVLTKKALTTTASAAVLTLASFAVLAVAAPGTASARCNGIGNENEIRSTLILNGRELVAEAPYHDTCNHNNIYNGHFASKVASYRAVVVIQNNNDFEVFYGIGPGSTANKDYSHGDNNSHSRMILCATTGDGLYRCGWGTNSLVRSGGPTAAARAAHAAGFSGVHYGF